MSARSIKRADRRRRERAGRRIATRAALSAALITGATAIGSETASADVIEVTNLNAAGDDSLLEAIDAANADPNSDTITFAAGLTGTIHLQTSLYVNYPVDIEGPGADAVTVDATNATYQAFLFYMSAPSRAASISGLKITNGYTPGNGGAIYSGDSLGGSTDLTVSDCVIAGNRAAESGGGIYSSAGSLTVRNSTISDNHVTSPNSQGGGIRVFGTDGDETTEVRIIDSILMGNSSVLTGAGAAILTDADAEVRGSTLMGNVAQEGAGGIAFSPDDADSSQARVVASTFSGNEGDDGGGIGAFSVNLQLTSSTVTGNTAGNGGGVLNVGNNVRTIMEGSTIVSNHAEDRGGGAYLPSTTSTIRSTIVAGNTAGLDSPELHGPADLTHALVGNTSGATLTESPPGSNKLNLVDPQLGPLADNGGPTLTLLPALASPAIDAGLANGLTTDQRGLDRTVDGSPANFAGSDGTDIGAVERDIALEGAKVKAKKTQKQKGKKIVVKVKVSAAEAATAKAKGKIGKSKLKTTTKPITADKTTVLKLKPKGKKTSKKLAKALKKGKKLKAKLSVTITDEAGNSETKKPKVKLK